MKKIFALVLSSLILIFSMTACNNNNVSLAEKETYSDDGYENADALSQEVKVEVLNKYTYSAEQDDMLLPDGVTLPSLEANYVILDIEITNLTEEDIESVSGTLNIMNGDYKVKLICDFDQQTISADDSVVYEGYYFQLDTARFNMAEKVIFDCDYRELEFEFVPNEINYQ